MEKGDVRTIGDLIAKFYITLRVNHDFLLTIYGDDLRSAVRVAGVINQPSETTILTKLTKKRG